MFPISLKRAAICVLTIGLLMAADVAPGDGAAIRKLISAFEEGENKHDGQAIARLFLSDSPDREPVAKRIASEGGVWTEKSPMRFRVDGIRAIHDDVALVDTTATWYQSGLIRGSSQQMLVLVKDHGEWKISAYRRTCKAIDSEV
ncbi:MAG: hypothetical protein ACR2NN_14485 [Bryobacteraceae bacterium]